MSSSPLGHLVQLFRLTFPGFGTCTPPVSLFSAWRFHKFGVDRLRSPYCTKAKMVTLRSAAQYFECLKRTTQKLHLHWTANCQCYVLASSSTTLKGLPKPSKTRPNSPNLQNPCKLLCAGFSLSSARMLKIHSI